MVLGVVLMFALLIGGVMLLIEFTPCDAKCKAAPSEPYQGGGGG
ncbi:hypothetical protein [Streptacidiphilus rugosus]|nr:hypothetical protein [Streptacidiphilus rugosus]